MATSPTNIPAGRTLFVDAYDEDIAEDDPIMRCQFAPLTAHLLHVGEGVGSGAIGTLTVRFSTNGRIVDGRSGPAQSQPPGSGLMPREPGRGRRQPGASNAKAS